MTQPFNKGCGFKGGASDLLLQTPKIRATANASLLHIRAETSSANAENLIRHTAAEKCNDQVPTPHTIPAKMTMDREVSRRGRVTG